MSPAEPALKFDVHPSVAYRLGSELVSDDVQAILELVKNSYDAGATSVSVEIASDTPAIDGLPETLFPQAKGFIRIHDNGHGMDRQMIRDGWLVVSNSAKRQAKKDNKDFPSGRVPLGDKGLGRLGTQRLAKNIELLTTAVGDAQRLHVAFSWEDFGKASKLGDVMIREGPVTKSSQHGTTLFLTDLVDSSGWKDTNATLALQTKLSELISPFHGIAGLAMHVRVNGEDLDRVSISKRLRSAADTTFDFEFNGTHLVLTGKVKLRYLEPSGKRKTIFAAHVLADSGEGLLARLQARAKDATDFSVRSEKGSWYCSLHQSVAVEDIADLAMSEGQFATPGPFKGELDGFDFDNLSETAAFGTRKEFAALVKSLAGVRVYRDGFGVRVDRDFLKLARAWTSGSSWYGLKPANTIGYINISADANRQLEETTDREGFKSTPAYRNFEVMLAKLVKFTQESLEFLRRETIAYCDLFAKSEAGLDEHAGPDAASDELAKTIDRARAQGDAALAIRKSAESAALRLEEVAAELADDSLEPDLERKRMAAMVVDCRTLSASLASALQAVERVLADLGVAQRQAAVVHGQIEVLKEQWRSAVHAIGVYTTTEALTHEIAFIAHGLANRAAELRRTLGKAGETERTQAFLRHVESAVAGLRRQLSHIEPSLKFSREKREPIDIREFLAELREYHALRWASKELVIDVGGNSRTPFAIRVNRGKLTQVFDNLIANSEYWLGEELRLKRLNEGVISIETHAPRVLFADNGRGIDPAVDDSLFEPFVTRREKGRGLGLFVVRELMDSMGGSVRLLPDQNRHGRRYTFELDFEGSLNDND